MRERAYYNENDPFVAEWLRRLVDEELITPGVVDDRPIQEVRPADLEGFTRCHFFAGIAGWELALALAGWADGPVWTGSCPCQPFSGAGKRGGAEDERHLWPAWFDLIRKCQPPTIFGEQVASADGRLWFSAVRADLETLDYAVGAADLCAAGVGAPHIRQRLWFMADATVDSGVGDSSSAGAGRDARAVPRAQEAGDQEGVESRGESDGSVDAGADSGMGVSSSSGNRADEKRGGDPESEAARRQRCAGGSGADNGGWNPCDWLPCSDGKVRPVEPGTFPLADGVLGRVGRLRAYGNAIVPQVAAAFIRAGMVR